MSRSTLIIWSAFLLGTLSSVPALAVAGPVHLHLSIQRKTETYDAAGRTQAIWVKLDAAQSAVHPGDVLRYDVHAENTGSVSVSGLAVTQPIPAGTVYVAHSAEGGSAALLYSLDGKEFSALPMQAVTSPSGTRRVRPAPAEAYAALRWHFAALPPHGSEDVTYQVKVR